MSVCNFIKYIWSRINWRPNVMTFVGFLAMIAVYPVFLYANPAWFVEDSWMENSQIVILLVTAMILMRATHNRRFFVFLALLLIFIIMRETSLGRGYFCRHYYPDDEFCKWDYFEYGFLAEWVKKVFLVYMVLYFFKYKLYRPLWKYIRKAPVYFWDMLILLAMVVFGCMAETASIDSEVLEEACETVCYLVFANCLYRYRQLNI